MPAPRPGLLPGPDRKLRCLWGASAPEYLPYHDEEWGLPTADDVRLFEKVCLEGFQSGLSWLTILRKREAFRRGFAGFDLEKVARFGARDVTRLLADAGIVRHRGKIESTINNARRACELRDELGSLAAYFWRFEPDPRIAAEAAHLGGAPRDERRRRSPSPCRRTSGGAAGPSSGRPPSMRSCRRSGS